jgi:hypothetical protein
MAQALLEQAIGHPAHWVAQLPHSHRDIVHAPEVIDYIAGLLDRVTV